MDKKALALSCLKRICTKIESGEAEPDFVIIYTETNTGSKSTLTPTGMTYDEFDSILNKAVAQRAAFRNVMYG